MSSETQWNQTAGSGEAADKALLKALGDYQARTGRLPGGYDEEEWEDIYRDALGNYQAQ